MEKEVVNLLHSLELEIILYQFTTVHKSFYWDIEFRSTS